VIEATVVVPELGTFSIPLKRYPAGWAGDLNNEGVYLVSLYINPKRETK
jgi:hypothetical protein